MGAYWLHDALVPLHVALGTKFHTYQNYQIRCRSSGGFNAIRGIVMHHDADGTSGEDNWVLKYEYETAKDGPIGNFHVTRTGDVWFGAAGASNHAGRGGPVSTSRGTVPLNAGNLYLIGIEASNNGIGEVWGTAIMNSYFTLVTELCRVFKLNPLTDIYSHMSWCQPSCPNRKVDPRGPTPSYPKIGGSSGTNYWNMQEVRYEINARLGKPPPNAAVRPPVTKPPVTTPPPTTVPTTGGMEKMLIMKYGGTPTANWGGWYSFDGGVTRKAVASMAHAGTLVDLGALDAKTKAKVTDRAWNGVSHTTSQTELDKYLTPYG